MGRKIAILGFAKQGTSALRYYQSKGDAVTVHDMDETKSIPEGVRSVLGKRYLDNLDDYDVIIRTPRLHPKKLTDIYGESILDKVTTVTNEFIEIVQQTAHVIGVTGTKGKGTTTLFTEGILREAGRSVTVCGNIGTSPFDVIEEALASEIVILELSNFQTIDLRVSPHTAVVLKITPEHLNWHTDFEEYRTAKKQMFVNQTPDDIAISCLDNKHSLNAAQASQGTILHYSTHQETDFCIADGDIIAEGEIVANVNDVQLLGEHNLENVCAAIAASWEHIQNDTAAIKRALRRIKGFEYRIEPLGEKNGINYVNDAFSSAPDSTMAAVKAMKTPTVLIIGGDNKNADYTELVDVIASDEKVHTLVTIGHTGPIIAEEVAKLRPIKIVRGGDKMTDIFSSATAAANPGDTVLLSAASSSFGLFKDFFDRGAQFTEAYNEL